MSTETKETPTPEQTKETPKTAPALEFEQEKYARVLAAGMRFGLMALMITFAIYVMGICAPKIEMNQISECWSMKASDFMKKAEIKDGWGWTQHIGYGDYMNLIGVAILATTPLICYLHVLPEFWRKKDYAYAGIAAMEVLILVLSISGVVKVGH